MHFHFHLFPPPPAALLLSFRYHCLWGGFTVNVPEGGKFYFAGDTGYRSVPKEVANNLEEEAKLPSCPAFKQV